MKRFYVLLSTLVLTSSLGAKIFVPQGATEFNNLIDRYPYAVVHYINYAQVGEDRLKQQALSSMKAAFGQSAHESSHLIAGIGFIGVNSRIAPDLITDIETRYQIKTGELAKDFSMVFVFKNGKPVSDKTGYLATLTNAFDQADLGDFIDKYLGDYISKELREYQAQQEEARRVWTRPTTRTVTRVIEQPVYRYRSPVYADPYYYGGYGYGGPWGYGRYGGYGYGPRFGFGIGFGGRWRRGYGYRRGPRFGFGIGF